MRFLLIGRGSMSVRRQRNLQALKYNDFTTWDITDEKPIEQVIQECKPDAMIISCPPKTKGGYITLAAKFGIPCFAEADTVTYDEGPYYPSSSLRFHPAVRRIKELLDNGTLGKAYTFTYHQGMNLRDWRPAGFNFKDYYAAKEGTREMFCFELSWLSYLFGTPVDTCGFIDKKLDDPDITADDVYATVVSFWNKKQSVKCVSTLNGFMAQNSNTITGTILIDIVSRPAIRELRIAGEKGTLEWKWSRDYILLKKHDGVLELWETVYIGKGCAAEGYNENIPEQMYIDEIKSFIENVNGKRHCKACMPKTFKEYPYSREEEEAVIKMLKKVEIQKQKD